jgi:hypothetical protein
LTHLGWFNDEFRPVRSKFDNGQRHYGIEPAEPPHNYVTGIGDVFDWLDHDTRMKVFEAIEINDADDIEAWAEVAGSYGRANGNQVHMLRAARRRAKEMEDA